ncbi:MAG: PHP domain-containing protein [Phycisphaerae bacterium]|nr:PHP domain-containing protein [Phycisphaerae bacterium]
MEIGDGQLATSRAGAVVAPLRVRSAYSLLRGTMTLDVLVGSSVRAGHTHLALTDINNLYGAPAFYRMARQAGLTPIIGAELHDGTDRLVALVENDVGYRNLCVLITRIQCCSDFSLRGSLGEFVGGLHFLVDSAELAGDLIGVVGRERLWLALDPPVQGSFRVRRLAECSVRLGCGLIACGTAHLARLEDRDAARLLIAIRTGSTFDSVTDLQLPHFAARLRGPASLAGELADFPRAIANNIRLAGRCGGYEFLPRQAVFPSFKCPDGLTPEAHLRGLCRRGMLHRYRRPRRDAEARIDRELSLIDSKGFSEYFLVVRDIVQYARSRGAPVAGRGSGASSLVAYLLGITNVCPLTYNIPFERFLNERRIDFPDLDIDFSWRIRDEVIDYAFERWGRERTAMVSAHNTFKASSALRETAKAFGYSNAQISQMSPDELTARPAIGRLAGRIVSLPHNLCVHPGGIVIAPGPIENYAPVQPSTKGCRILQYDKRGAKATGLIKLDLLGNRSLATIRQTADLVRLRHGPEIDVETLDPSDQRTIEMLQTGDTVGCNQLESPAMRNLLRAIHPHHMRDVMKALALVRPGAAGAGMKDAFIRRHRGLDPVPTVEPKIDAILADTYGVMLYEDDVMLVAAAMTGGSLPRGDMFRKAVQKCASDAERLELSSDFLYRCCANGIDDQLARSLWVQMAKFNSYSFCRAHAGSYGRLGYAVAYLKAHWPVEFWTAALNNNQSMYHRRVYVEQAKRTGVRFLPPDVNQSSAEYSIRGDAIGIGLESVAGLGPAGVQAILDTREKRPFDTLTDCILRTGLARSEVGALVLCGAFDFTGSTRPALMMELDMAISVRRTSRHRPPATGLFTAADRAGGLMCAPADTGDYSPARKYIDQRRILGVSTGPHIMKVHRAQLQGETDATSRDLPALIGKRVTIAGVCEARRRTDTAGGREMMFLTMDDEFGLFEATFFPTPNAEEQFNSYGPHIITGKVIEQYGTISIELAGRC